jgi:hypothetical protein
MKAWYGTGGALVVDVEIPGITQHLDAKAAEYYGGEFFIAESMSEKTAEKVAVALGAEYRGRAVSEK